jgi:site-specific recombinase XerD
MKEKIYHYETIMIDGCSGELLERIAEYMKIEFNDYEYEKAVDCEDFSDPECVCIFRDKNNKDRFVMLDTHGANYMHTFIVRCMEEEHDTIKMKLISIVNELREEEGEDLIDDLENTVSDNNGYNRALRRFNLNYL